MFSAPELRDMVCVNEEDFRTITWTGGLPKCLELCKAKDQGTWLGPRNYAAVTTYDGNRDIASCKCFFRCEPKQSKVTGQSRTIVLIGNDYWNLFPK